MLPKQYRINKEEIPLVARKGVKSQFDGFYLKFLQNDSLANSKFGIIIPKKAIKLSVNRNRVKRVFRAALADLIKDGEFKKVGFYVFFVSDEKLVDLALEDVKKQITLSLRA